MRTYARLDARATLGAVAAPRTVTCPSCGTQRETKGNPGVRLVCRSCGEPFLVPRSSEPPAPAPGPASSSSSSDDDLGGIRVTRGRPVIRQRARPRDRGAGDQLEGDQGAVAVLEQPAGDQLEGDQLEQPTAEERRRRLFQEAGRRGGLARYARERLGHHG